MKRFAIVTLIGAIAIAVPAFAQQTSPGSAAVPAEGEVAWTPGEVKKVDRELGKVTIKHGPLVNLGMPGMTMVFRVKEPGLLEKLKAGDNIQFKADKLAGNMTVVELKPD